jgi:hypothetical protein
MSTSEYVKVLEEEYGKNQAHKKKHIKKSTGINALYIPEKSKPDYSWTIKNRFNNLWKNFLMRFEYLSKYNPFDFKSYETEWNPYGFDVYAKIFQTSTPWNRFKRFCMELKGLCRGCRDAFFYTPAEIQHFQKNKKRISWFEENLSRMFADKLDVDVKKELNKLGYDLDGNGRLCYKVKE